MIGFIKNHKISLLLSCLIFVFSFIFFTCINPTMPDGTEDWLYVSYSRPAIPIWKGFNPTKILPETIMGLIGSIAAYIVKPIIGDYIWALTFSYAFFISTLITFYVVSLYQFIKKSLASTPFESLFVSIIFFSLHFLLFYVHPSENIYMFGASNLNCLMNYLTPSLLCGIIALNILKNNGLSFINKNKVYWIFVLYIAVFSNMSVNIILLAPTTFFFFKDLRKKPKFKSLSPYFYVFVLELICLIFEANGGRAQELQFNIVENINEMIYSLKTIAKSINITYLLFTLLTIIAFCIHTFIHKNKKEQKFFLALLYSFILCAIYTIALYIRIGNNKITRSENVMTIFMFYGFLVSYCLAYIVKNIRYVKFATGIILFITVVELIATCNARSYRDTLYHNSVNEAYTYNKNLIEKAIEADQNGVDEVRISDNGQKMLSTHPWSGDGLSNTLFKHGIIHRHIKIIIEE